METAKEESPKFVLEQRDQVEVYAGQNGHVCIKQQSYPDEESLIFIHPSDVPQLIKFLEDARLDAVEIRANLTNQS